MRENEITVAPSSPSPGEELSSLNRQGPQRRAENAEACLGFRAELDELLGRFERARLGEGDSPSTLRNYRRFLTAFFRYLSQKNRERLVPWPSVRDVASQDVLSYRDHLLTRPKENGRGQLQVSSAANHLSALKCFFQFLLKAEELLVDPCCMLKLPRRPRRLPRNIPTVGQMKRLVTVTREGKRHVDLRDAAIVELFYGTGLRNAELCGLLCSDYDAGQGLVFVRKGKGGKDRVVPVGKKAREGVERYLLSRGPLQNERDAPLFLTTRGTPVTPHAIRQLVGRLTRRAGLGKKRFTPHTLRHACATHLLKGKADIRHIQVLLGHSSLQTTQLYTHLDTADLKRVLSRCHPREKKSGFQEKT